MSETNRDMSLVGHDERLSLELGGARLFYRRLSLGALAAIERQQMRLLPGAQGAGPRIWLPPEALNAAIAAHVLLGWEGVRGLRGEPAPYSPETARRLPAGARSALIERAFAIDTNGEEP
ncbi:MAG: hypothetical protein KQH53_18930 [Desulfarculaceae bacterium]|nr:hypothetical protein [Desulfarculaceae bacterium]